jgi:transcriptional regulator with XRE-family HTH domain
MMRQLEECVPSARFRHPGELIKYTRKKLGLSQKYVAYKAHMSPSGLCKLESGERMLPRNVFEISDVLKLDPRKLVELNTNKTRTEKKSLEDMKREFPNWRELFRESLKDLV